MEAAECGLHALLVTRPPGLFVVGDRVHLWLHHAARRYFELAMR